MNRQWFDVVLLTPTLSEAQRSRLLPHTVGQRDHLGLGYLAAEIRRQGGEVLLIDCLARKLGPRELAAELAGTRYALAGVYTYQDHAEDVRSACAVLKACCPEAPVVLGGNAATVAWEHWLDLCSAADGVLIGEGEASVTSLLNAAHGRSTLDEVPGIALRGSSGMRPPRAPPDLDDLAWPLRPSLDLGVEECSITTSRGCVFRCSFCAVPEMAAAGGLPRIRFRSVDGVADEVESLVKGRRVRYLSFVDDLFFGTGRAGVERCHNLFDRFERKRLQFEFGITCRASDVEPELFLRLRRAGLRTVYFGAESLADHDLKVFRKDSHANTNRIAIHTCQKLGIRFHLGFIMVHPTASLDSLEENVRSLHRLGLWEYALKHRLLSRRMYLFRGTVAARTFAQAGGFDYDFTDPRVRAYVMVAERLEHEAFFWLAVPAQLARLRSSNSVPADSRPRGEASSLPRDFLVESFERLAQWFSSQRSITPNDDGVAPWEPGF